MTKKKYQKKYLIPLVTGLSFSNLILGFLFTDLISSSVDESSSPIHKYYYPLIHCLGAGLAVGSFLTNFLIQYQRRTFLIICCIILFVTFPLLEFDSISLLVGKIIQGLCLGCMTSITMIWVTEVSPSIRRGAFGCYSLCGFYFGQILGACFYSVDYRATNAMPAIFSVIFLCVLIWKLKDESGRFWLSRNDPELAKMIAGKIFPIEKVEKELLEWSLELPLFNNKFGSRKALLFASLIAFFQEFSGCNLIVFCSTQLFEGERPMVGIFLIAVTGCIFCATLILIIENFGRRILSIFGTMTIGLTMLFAYIFIYRLKGSWLEINVIAADALTLGPISLIYITEILPPRGACLAFSVNWVCFIALFAFFDSEQGYREFGFIICAIIMILAAVFMTFLLPETKRRTLREIQRYFGYEKEVNKEKDNPLSAPILNHSELSEKRIEGRLLDIGVQEELKE